MKINEIKKALIKLNFTSLCDDNKSLIAYNQIQHFLYDNKVPMKSITNMYIDKNGNLIICLYNDNYFEAGYSIFDEQMQKSIK